MSESPTVRYEMKFPCWGESGARLLSELRLHSAAIRELHPPRTVQSIYLDTAEGRAIRDNEDGLSERRKIRFRWYGAGFERVQGQIEAKVRSNQLGWKHVEQVQGEIQVNGVARWQFVPSLCAAVSETWREELGAGLEPVQWISYERSYWATACRRVRLTVDQRLICRDLRFCARIQASLATEVPPLAILEVKADQQHSDVLRAVVDELPIRPDRCSKFILASDPRQAPRISLW